MMFPLVHGIISSGNTETPASIFGPGDVGEWLDFTDISKLYTDLAGTTPVSSSGDKVRSVMGSQGNLFDLKTITANDPEWNGQCIVGATSGSSGSVSYSPNPGSLFNTDMQTSGPSAMAFNKKGTVSSDFPTIISMGSFLNFRYRFDTGFNSSVRGGTFTANMVLNGETEWNCFGIGCPGASSNVAGFANGTYNSSVGSSGTGTVSDTAVTVYSGMEYAGAFIINRELTEEEMIIFNTFYSVKALA